MTPKIERLTDAEGSGISEAPHWDIATQALYYVGIFDRTIHKYEPKTKRDTRVKVGTKQVSFVIPVEGQKDQFVISLEREIVKVSWDGSRNNLEIIEKLCEVEENSIEKINNRFNDGKCDPTGRLWAGTLNTVPEAPMLYPPKGTLYSIDNDKHVKVHLENLRVSNGLAFNEKLQKMYFIDSSKRGIDQYDIDFKSGTISNGRSVFSLPNNNVPGIPDGMTIDADGNLWVAVFNGNRVLKVDPRKPETLLQEVIMPVKQITSVAFGGEHLDELYVTTASFPLGNEQDLAPPKDGALYRISNLGVNGLPAVNFKS